MRHPTARKGVLALALCLLAAAEVRAEAIPWYYSSTPIPGDILSTNSDPGKITLTGVTSGQITGPSSIVLANLSTASSASPSDPAVFKHAGYTLALTIIDGDTTKAGTMFFSGKLHGVLSSGSSLILNHFTGKPTQSQVIGKHRYTVTVGPFAPPGLPGVGTGSIGAMARVSIQEVPEPSTLALSGLGLSLLGAYWWRRRCGQAALATL